MEDTSKIDVVSYGEFRKNHKQYENYGAVFFDEAQQLRNTTSTVAKAALHFNHPRKVPLTASVLEKSPMDLFNLIAVAKNKGKDLEALKKESQHFVNTFCIKVGNKVVGLKDDPTTKRKFKERVQANTFYVDKTDVKEVP
jgi:SNF2 family DNA or RNA helicase